ncbi:DUF247 domain protein [Trifolium medium]|uniref:DUF247 domain protein n=1 Tax=Trifolium medium TaxID=97028 RepID=A0A392NMN5_9FABA|nr:DUF247 domain protein [Trifolium medium]
MWAAQYIENAKLDPHILHKKIADNIDDLKGLFSDDVLTLSGTKESLEGFTSHDEKLSWMLFVDGCSLLHILENADLRKAEPVNNRLDHVILVMRDILLLENQLPCLVLKLLWKNNNETELINTMKGFLKWHQGITSENKTELKDTMKKTWRSHCFSVQKKNEKKKEEHSVPMPNESESELPIHLLHLYRKIMLPEPSSKIRKVQGKTLG